MGAECDRCGYDLPFMADCAYCKVVRQRDALLEALEGLIRHATDDTPHTQSWVEARAAIAQAKGASQ